MQFLKSLFKSKATPAQPVRNISLAPGQTQEEQDENRRRMEAELDASRSSRKP